MDMQQVPTVTRYHCCAGDIKSLPMPLRALLALLLAGRRCLLVDERGDADDSVVTAPLMTLSAMLVQSSNLHPSTLVSFFMSVTGVSAVVALCSSRFHSR